MNLPQNKAFCDTSFFFASLSPDDSNYSRAGEILEFFRENKISLYTTCDIISETITLLRYRASYKLSIEFIDVVRPSLHIVHYNDSVRMAAAEIFKKLSRDKRLSFCDSISYVVITHMLENMPCFSFDSDFRSLGLTMYP
ncbi:MAG: PIN domain-containing protein [Thermodesulfovibrionales bacterium]|nr:PIN domain-containing protein [Thermodesulfovibrionales bacterium]MDP3112049.1 PIN domain-containing protein [Thermodesulfovibrionales bacterium]